MRTLALDYGLARVGCALSDPTGTLVRPIDTTPPDPGAIAALVEEHEVGRIVVGLPVSLDGTENEQARLTREFCREVSEAVGVPVETYAERLTTRMAQASRRAGAGASEDPIRFAISRSALLSATGARAARTLTPSTSSA